MVLTHTVVGVDTVSDTTVTAAVGEDTVGKQGTDHGVGISDLEVVLMVVVVCSVGCFVDTGG